MARKVEKQPTLPEEVFVVDLMNAGNFCFSCDQIFKTRKCLEEHVCTSVSFICSCGDEFREYNAMLKHSTTHEPGHQVLDHETIKKRRIENWKEEDEKIKRLQKGEVVWNTSTMESGSSASVATKSLVHIPNNLASKPQTPKIIYSSELFPSMSQKSFKSASNLPNVFPGASAPTVDLWTLYQPVVLLNTDSKLHKKIPYTCGRCGQSFMKKASLISHHSLHVTDKVSGCIGCGMLLSSKKMVPRFHACNASNNTTKFKIITAKPLNYKLPSVSSLGMRSNARAQFYPMSSHLQAKKSRADHKGGVSSATSTLQGNNKSSTGLEVTPTLLFKNRNIGASKPFAASSFQGKIKALNPTSRHRINVSRSAAPFVQIQLPTHSQLGLCGKSPQTSSTQGAFTCRVCHFPFESALLLQRHKCSRAKEFMAHHLRFSNQPIKPRVIAPMASSSFNQMNGQRKLAPAPGMKNTPVGLDKRQGGGVPVSVKIDLESDDDCYIVESRPDNPAEMIYQITSSVPIKT